MSKYRLLIRAVFTVFSCLQNIDYLFYVSYCTLHLSVFVYNSVVKLLGQVEIVNM